MKKNNILPAELDKQVREASKKCYACGKCMSGCPVASAMDFPPAKILKLISLGDIDTVLASRAIWVCTSCQNCYSRCPFEINIPHIIDRMKQFANTHNRAHTERATRVFHKVFLANVKNLGRINEAGMIGLWKLFSGKWFSDIKLGLQMFRKGKLKFIPEKVKDRRKIKQFFKT